jgi:hypothetical protein
VGCLGILISRPFLYPTSVFGALLTSPALISLVSSDLVGGLISRLFLTQTSVFVALLTSPALTSQVFSDLLGGLIYVVSHVVDVFFPLILTALCHVRRPTSTVYACLVPPSSVARVTFSSFFRFGVFERLTFSRSSVILTSTVTSILTSTSF